MNKIELKIDGYSYTGWQKINVVRSIEALAARFDITLTDRSPFKIPRGTEITLLLYGEVVITGYVDTLEATTAPEAHSLTITGRDKTGDLVDCATLVSSQELINVTLREIIEQVIQPFGILAIFETEPPTIFKKFSFQEETAYEAIERACRLRGVFASTDTAGNLIIHQYGTERAGDGLIMGKNVLSATSRFDEKDRFAEYRVYGQQPGNDNITAQAASQPQGFATDLGITRYRPKIVIAEGAVDDEISQQRAEWEAAVRAARASSVTVTTVGWQDKTGGLWKVNTLVPCELPQNRIEGDMLIKETRFTLDDNAGEKAELMLVRPDAYITQPDIEAESIGFQND